MTFPLDHEESRAPIKEDEQVPTILPRIFSYFLHRVPPIFLMRQKFAIPKLRLTRRLIKAAPRIRRLEAQILDFSQHQQSVLWCKHLLP